MECSIYDLILLLKYKVLCVLLVLSKFSANIASIKDIPTLNGSNYKEWKDQLEIVFGLVDLDVVLQSDKPVALAKDSTNDEKLDMSLGLQESHF
jgi:hypothetical protein